MDQKTISGSRIVILISIFVAALAGAIAFGLSRSPSPVILNVIPPQPTPLPSPTSNIVRFHVVGCVNTPGVYTLPAGALVQDALKAAGGPTADADMEPLNLAVQIQDQEQIVVARSTRSTTPTPRTNSARTKAIDTDLPVDINTATSELLQELPGIGPVIAERIIDYREQNGEFNQVEDLTKVKGIGEKTLEKLRPLITAGD